MNPSKNVCCVLSPQVSQSYGAFNHILGDLSLIVNQFESLSAFSAGIDRLGEFLERMESMSENHVSRSMRFVVLILCKHITSHHIIPSDKVFCLLLCCLPFIVP